jgi:hypothetical protein
MIDEPLQTERIVVAIERIAEALAGIYETKQKELAKRYPERKEPRDAVVTRIPTEDDRIREEHGASEEPIEEWIGIREREYLANRASAKAEQRSESAGTGAETPEGEA